MSKFTYLLAPEIYHNVLSYRFIFEKWDNIVRECSGRDERLGHMLANRARILVSYSKELKQLSSELIYLTDFDPDIPYDCEAINAKKRKQIFFEVTQQILGYGLVLSGRIKGVFAGRQKNLIEVLPDYPCSICEQQDSEKAISYTVVYRNTYNGNEDILTLCWNCQKRFAFKTFDFPVIKGYMRFGPEARALESLFEELSLLDFIGLGQTICMILRLQVYGPKIYEAKKDNLEGDNGNKSKVDYYEYINSEAWAKKSQEKKESIGYRCQICNSTENLTTHHRTYEHLGDEPLDDLTVLCWDCHRLFHENRRLQKNETA